MSATKTDEKSKTENLKKEKDKTEKDKKEKEDATKAEKNKQPTKVQLEKWTSSINSLLVDPNGVAAFRNFLVELEANGEEGEYTKYIDFYVRCEKYKVKFKELEDEAKEIFEEFLAIGADKEVATGGKSVEIGDKLEDEGLEGVTIFDEPMLKVKQKLADKLYGNFCIDLKNKLKL
ncbi:regulator of G-protein signaling 10 isoform X2 [Procambarus clarkii]|uniref:regulator of G-protein signaling 10 isoform X2 n=1 Tax=Procambarus clarkii TaxID=6728 RepID=UPI0037435D48